MCHTVCHIDSPAESEVLDRAELGKAATFSTSPLQLEPHHAIPIWDF